MTAYYTLFLLLDRASSYPGDSPFVLKSRDYSTLEAAQEGVWRDGLSATSWRIERREVLDSSLLNDGLPSPVEIDGGKDADSYKHNPGGQRA